MASIWFSDLMKLLFNIQISCHTLIDIINKTIIVAQYHNRNFCLVDDLKIALLECKFVVENYASIQLNDSHPQVIAYQQLVDSLTPQTSNNPAPSLENQSRNYCVIS